MAQTTAELETAGIRPLTDPEQGRLAECETVIKKGLNTFLEVGAALAEIHDAMLYRETHKDFKKYCKDVWDLGKSTAHQKMDGYRAVKFLESKMSAIADTLSAEKEDETVIDVLGLDPNTLKPREIILPTNEAQARKLRGLDPDDQVKTWTLVLKQFHAGKKLTAALVGKAAKEVKGETTKRRGEKKINELDATERLSNLFKRQCKVMEEIINDERNDKWKNASKKEVVKWLKYLVTLAEDDD